MGSYSTGPNYTLNRYRLVAWPLEGVAGNYLKRAQGLTHKVRRGGVTISDAQRAEKPRYVTRPVFLPAIENPTGFYARAGFCFAF